jgi:uncharacterized YkwD family protein/spore coat assembly protein SafA
MKIIQKLYTACLAIILSATISQTIQAATDIYTVQKGDTLWIISKKYQVGLSEIIEANPKFEDPNVIHPGDKVNIPLPNQAEKNIEEEVVDLVNIERSKAGLVPLSIDWQVSRVAKYKSEEMRDKNYFSHTSPNYGSPFDMLKAFNISYKSAGENIAKGQTTAKAVVNSWMNSEGHRKNILSPTFTHLGVGYASGNGSTFWTQLFIKP